MSREPLDLIADVKGCELVDLDQAETCCGFGGTFAVKYPDISGAMLRDKVDNVVKTSAEALVSCDMGCLMHISGALSRLGQNVKPMHIAQLLEGQTTK